jgi:hypothetical protein
VNVLRRILAWFKPRPPLTLALPANLDEIRKSGAAAVMDAEAEAQKALAEQSSNAWRTPSRAASRFVRPMKDILGPPPPTWEKAVADIEDLACQERREWQRNLAAKQEIITEQGRVIFDLEAKLAHLGKHLEEQHEAHQRALEYVEARDKRLRARDRAAAKPKRKR